jgi:sugar O-acyltransferase (sialic acid O-acetyltransferase NeuD family)
MDLILMGGGKFAGYIYSKFKDLHNFIGYLDDVYEVAFVEELYGLIKLGTTKDISRILKICNNVCITVGSEGNLEPRIKLFDTFINAGFQFPTLIDSSAKMFGEPQIDQGTIIEENVSIGPLTTIGRNCRIAPNTFIGHDVLIGDNVFTGPGVIINGSCKIGEKTFLGSGAIVIQKKQIGNNCIIGAGTVVTGNIPDHSVAVGIPARIIRNNS